MASEAKRLFCTTDDLGMCHAVNDGIFQALQQGWAQASNFIAPAPWFREAAARGRGAGLDLGVHLCLFSDWDQLSWGPLTANPRLKTAEGSLPSRPEGLLECGATDADIYDELKVQILLVQRLYGAPSHFDSHIVSGRRLGGIHDRIQSVIEALSREFKLPYTYARRPDDTLLHFKAEACMSGWDRATLLKELDAWTEPGDYHLFGHAAVDSAELDAMCSPQHPARRWARDWRVSDLALYLDKDLPGELLKRGFQLVRIKDVAK